MGMIKGRNSKNQMDALEVNKKLQGYTEETERNVLMTLITMVVRSHTWSQTSWKVKSSGP